MDSCTGIIDCRVDTRLENEFLVLNVWGKPVFSYAVSEALKCSRISRTIVLTDSEQIISRSSELFGKRISVYRSFPTGMQNYILISGRAIMVRAETIGKAVQMADEGMLCSSVDCFTAEPQSYRDFPSFLSKKPMKVPVNAFIVHCENTGGESYFKLSPKEAVVINTRNDFELAVVLKKKELNAKILADEILSRIDEKRKVLSCPGGEKGICLIGHSQIDNWDVEELAGRKVRNCGIKGISGFEYKKYILDGQLLECGEDTYVMMHGTNDILYDFTPADIVDNLNQMAAYIKSRKKGAAIFFVSCLHVNGRLDRDNGRIDCLNHALRSGLSDVYWIDCSEMDDGFGNLKQQYTSDGLHLSPAGYDVLKGIIENELNKKG